MNRLNSFLTFHPDGKPRGWVRRLLFQQGKTPRKMFRRMVFKKDGRVRQHFEAWMIGPSVPRLPDTLPGRPDAWAEALEHLGPRGQTLRRLRPLEDTVLTWIRHAKPKHILSTDELARRLQDSLAGGRDWMLISVGHDDYTRISGGVQMCLQREEQRTLANGGIYLNIHPWQPLPKLADPTNAPDLFFNLTLDGLALGACRMADLKAAVAGMAAKAFRMEVAVHQMLGHSPEEIAELVKSTGSNRCVFWLHDFLTLCPSFTLQRNDLSFCAAPPLTSNSCALCIYGAERVQHTERMAAFFRSIEVHLVSPSKVTLDFWTKHTDLPTKSTRVEPHMKLEWTRLENPSAIDSEKPVTVGFLGTPAAHKGWPIFERLSKDEELTKGFRFLLFSASSPPGSTIKRIGVHVTAETPTAMSDAIAANGVDIALHWPSWPETFSLTTYEAMAGGAYLVTNRISGNVAATVHELERGAVLADEDELLDFFRSGRAAAMAQQSRASRAGSSVRQSLSDMSVSMLVGAR